MEVVASTNSEAIQAWNTVLFDKFSRFRETTTTGFSCHSTRALAMHRPPSGARVVDIGCGFGDTCVELAGLVGPGGRAVGIDAAPRFIDLCRSETSQLGNVRFHVEDVEASVSGGPYELAFSRFGTLFFANPVVALRKIRMALVPGGTLCMIVWRKREANDVFYAPELAVRELLGHPAKGDNVTCGPGPFSMASADLVGDQLVAAGYTDIVLARNDDLIRVGVDLADAVQFCLTIGPAGEVVRLAGEQGVARRGEVEAALRRVLEPFVRPDGVWMPSSTWIVSAASPST
jgi:ubiquinone/menaquinone biosynthesis C-methylase UbiE